MHRIDTESGDFDLYKVYEARADVTYYHVLLNCYELSILARHGNPVGRMGVSAMS